MVFPYPYIYIIMREFFFVEEIKFLYGREKLITIFDIYNF